MCFYFTLWFYLLCWQVKVLDTYMVTRWTTTNNILQLSILIVQSLLDEFKLLMPKLLHYSIYNRGFKLFEQSILPLK